MARYFSAPPRVPTTAEVEACLAVLDNADRARDHMMIAMAATTGLRVSEMVALNWNQVCTDAGNIRHRVALVAENTKGNVGGDIVIPERLRWKLAQYRTWCARRGLVVEGNAPMFVSRNHRRVSVRRVQQMWKETQAEAGIDRPYRMHALRHYYATTVYSASKDIRVTQIAMRHQSLSSTMVYTHVTANAVEKAVERAF